MSVDWEEKYKTLKRKLQILIYEQESFVSELEKAQRKLLRVSGDKSFLLDRLLLYEQVSEDSSHDSDATLSSDCESELPPKRRAVVNNCKTEANTTNGFPENVTLTNRPKLPEESLVKGENQDVKAKSNHPQTNVKSIKQENSGRSLNVGDVERQLSTSAAGNSTTLPSLDPYPTSDLPKNVFE